MILDSSMLIQARRSLGLRQYQIAEAIGTSQGMIAYYEGRNTRLKRERAESICSVLGIELSDAVVPDPVPMCRCEHCGRMTEIREVTKCD